jgi:Beta/Gamma crystallin
MLRSSCAHGRDTPRTHQRRRSRNGLGRKPAWRNLPVAERRLREASLLRHRHRCQTRTATRGSSAHPHRLNRGTSCCCSASVTSEGGRLRSMVRGSMPGLFSQARSLQVRGGVWEVCESSGFRGCCVTVSSDVANLESIGLRNVVGSVRAASRTDSALEPSASSP